jgi:hypothetical protein
MVILFELIRMWLLPQSRVRPHCFSFETEALVAAVSSVRPNAQVVNFNHDGVLTARGR